MTKYFLLIVISFLETAKIYSQSDSIKLEGKWTVCVSSQSFSKDFDCQKGYMTYEFFKDGKFKDPRPVIYGEGEHPFMLGRWTLKGSILTIDYDDDKYSKSPPTIHKMIVLSNRKFYEIGEEGPGVTVYTYYQKID